MLVNLNLCQVIIFHFVTLKFSLSVITSVQLTNADIILYFCCYKLKISQTAGPNCSFQESFINDWVVLGYFHNLLSRPLKAGVEATSFRNKNLDMCFQISMKSFRLFLIKKKQQLSSKLCNYCSGLKSLF